MPIGSISDSHRQISVVEPVSPALEHVKRMLFKPFDLGKWFTIGFCAWLAYLGESGGVHGNFGGGNNVTNGHAEQSVEHFCNQTRDYVVANLSWLIPLAVGLFVFCIALWMLMLWLNCRGKFMFLHCVALDKAEVSEPWNKFAEVANSLFWFRLVLGVIGMVVMLPLLIFDIVLIVGIISHTPDVGAIMAAVGLGFLLFIVVIFFALIQKFTTDFVVPIQFLRGGRCLDAWKELWQLLCAHAGLFTLYILFQIAIAMAIGAIVFFTVLITCCIAGCLMAIPYIGTVLLLPVLIFKRAYSLYFFRQFGAAYDVFPPEPPAPAPTGLQPLPRTPAA